MNTTIYTNLIKEFAIETKGKRKKLQIVSGNIFDDSCDMLAVTAYEEQGGPDGEMFQSFINRYYADSKMNERRILSSSNTATMSVTEIGSNQFGLLLYLNEKEGQQLDITRLANVLKMLFTSIATYIYEGNRVGSVALPVVFRKGIKEEEYHRYIQTYVYEAADFLRKHSSVDQIKIYLWHEEDQKKWVYLLNEMIPGHVEVFNSSNHMKKLIQNIRTELYEIRSKGIVTKYCNTINWALYDLDVRLTHLTNASVRIIDWLTKGLCGIKGVPESWANLHVYLRMINMKSNRIESEWFITYLINIYEFNRYIRNKNNTVKEDDLYLYMSYLLRMLQYCNSDIERKRDKS
jgi:hypothetical protein